MSRAPARTFVCEHCGRVISPEEASWIDLDPELEPRMLFALCADTEACQRAARDRTETANPFAVCFVPSRRVH